MAFDDTKNPADLIRSDEYNNLVDTLLNHSDRHKEGGSDELDAADLSGTSGTSGQFLKTDGSTTSFANLPAETRTNLTLTSGGITQFADGLSNEEVDRVLLGSEETLSVERIEVRQKGGGTNSNFSVRVQDVTASSTIGSQTLGGTVKDVGTSDSGNQIQIQLSNSSGDTINASYKISAVIQGV